MKKQTELVTKIDKKLESELNGVINLVNTLECQGERKTVNFYPAEFSFSDCTKVTRGFAEANAIIAVLSSSL